MKTCLFVEKEKQKFWIFWIRKKRGFFLEYSGVHESVEWNLMRMMKKIWERKYRKEKG
jgi:hypothetical protein